MTPPVRPEPEKPWQKAQRERGIAPTEDVTLAATRVIMRGYAEQGATHEEIMEIFSKRHPELLSTFEQEWARTPLTATEKVRGGLGSALQGATFNFSDEIVGGARGALDRAMTMGEGIADERSQLQDFRAAMPKTALGLELGGGLASGIGAAGAASKGAFGMAKLAPAARIAATGAGGGALAGVGAGESAGGRLGLGAAGAAGGFLLGKGAEKIATSRVGDKLAAGGRKLTDMLNDLSGDAGGGMMGAVPEAVPSAMQYPGMTGIAQAGVPAQRAALRAFGGPEGVAKSRGLLDMLESQGLGGDALAMNVGDDQTVRAVRAAANQPGSKAGQIVNERLARQGGALGEAVPRDIGDVTGLGGTPGPIRLNQMQKELSGKVGAGYDAFRALPEVPLDPSDEAQRLFIERYVDPVIRNRQLTGNLSGASALSGENVDAAFKNLQREIRGANAAVAMGNKNTGDAGMLEAMRDRVLRAIGETDPNYAQLARTYALDEDVGKVVQEAFDVGQGLPGKPVGTATVALGETTDAGQNAMRAGHATALQQRAGERASNADLGDLAQFRDVARAVVGTPAARQQFVEIHGQEAYDAMLARLMPKIQAAAQNAAARGNSTTAKQILDALAFGDDATLDALTSLASGSPAGAVRQFVGKKLVGPLDRAYRLGVGQTAGETADLLTTKGTGNVRSLLDMLEELGQADASRRAAVQPVTGAVTRTTVNR